LTRLLTIRALAALLLLLAGSASAQQRAPKQAPPPVPPPAEQPAPPPTPDYGPDIQAIRSRLDEVEKELVAEKKRADDEAAARADAEKKAADEKAAAEARAAKERRPPGHGILIAPGVVLSSYIQAQYESHQDSEDAVAQNGAPLNQDRFLVRRGRVKLTGDWEYAGLLFELNGGNTRGLYNVNVQHAEASLHYREDPSAPPLVELALGVIDQPFGFDLTRSSRERYFVERAFGVRSLFQGPPDVGGRVAGNWRFFRWTLALMNGEPLNEAGGFPGLDPTGNKDVFLRVGFAGKVGDTLRLSGDVSALKGSGFHAGATASKARLEWKDSNENGVIDPGETTPVSAVTATQSLHFDRWASGADVQLAWKNPLGDLRVAAEIILAENLDRNLFPADPIVDARNTREFAWYVEAVQEIGDHFFAGIRYDVYDPDSDVLDTRGGKVFKDDQTIRTVSPIAGLMIIDRARLLAEYDFISDHLARNSAGVPADLPNDIFTLRLQVQM
jgi:hypothetical protein